MVIYSDVCRVMTISNYYHMIIISDIFYLRLFGGWEQSKLIRMARNQFDAALSKDKRGRFKMDSFGYFNKTINFFFLRPSDPTVFCMPSAINYHSLYVFPYLVGELIAMVASLNPSLLSL